MNAFDERSATLVSGGTSGLGLKIALNMASQGKSVIICGRKVDSVQIAIEQLKILKKEEQILLGFDCDVSDKKSVDAMFRELNKKNIQIEALICNAGVIGPINKFLECDAKVWVEAFNINLYGTVNLIHAALPGMICRKSGRIIHISGGGASAPLFGMTSYAASKIATVRLIETLSLEYKEFGVTFNSIAPGILKTKLLDQMIEAGPDRIGATLFNKSSLKLSEQIDSTKKALELVDFLISKQSSSVTGKLISAEWDNWSQWMNHEKELNNSDVYTLRRIVGRDRNITWGDI